MQLLISKRHWSMMQTHVEREAPREACGLLAGKKEAVKKVFLIANQVKSRIRFRMEPVEQLKAFLMIETEGLELVGIFHSHPDGPENLSQMDIEEAAYPVVQVIWSRRNGAWQARGFWLDEGFVKEVELRVR